MSRNFVNSLAIAPRGRLVATAIVYGLSLAIRFTSATGEEVEISAQSLQGINPVMSNTGGDDAQLPHADRGTNSAQSLVPSSRLHCAVTARE
jgi:hypothetical protein